MYTSDQPLLICYSYWKHDTIVFDACAALCTLNKNILDADLCAPSTESCKFILGGRWEYYVAPRILRILVESVLNMSWFFIFLDGLVWGIVRATLTVASAVVYYMLSLWRPTEIAYSKQRPMPLLELLELFWGRSSLTSKRNYVHSYKFGTFQTFYTMYIMLLR